MRAKQGKNNMTENKPSKKRGPAKKPGFRQELRVTPIVEKVFSILREKHQLKSNSEALNLIAQTYFQDILQKESS